MAEYENVALSFVAIALGMSLVPGELRRRNMGLASTRWPTVTGTVLSVGAEGIPVNSPIVEAVGSVPVVQYRYAVNGKEYVGDRLDFTGRLSAGRWPTTQALRHYKAGQDIKVYYNPKNPQQSVLNPGSDTGINFRIFVGGIFIFLGLIGLFL